MSFFREIEQETKALNKPVYFVQGDAAELVGRAGQMLEAAAVQRCSVPSFNHWAGSCREQEILKALVTARTVPMMSDCRIVVMRDIQLASEAGFTALVEYLKKPVESTVLILIAGKFPGVKKGGKAWSRHIETAAGKVGRVFKIRVKDVRVHQYAADHARALGKMIGRREVDVLLSAVGNDLSVIAREVEKLCLFIGSKDTIAVEDVGECCSVLAEEGLWELTSGLAEQNPERALRALHRRLEEGAAPHQLLGQVGWQVRELVTVRDYIGKGLNDRQIQSKIRTKLPTLKALRAPGGSRFSRPEIVLSKLATANREMNRHRAGGRRIIESLILDLCT